MCESIRNVPNPGCCCARDGLLLQYFLWSFAWIDNCRLTRSAAISSSPCILLHARWQARPLCKYHGSGRRGLLRHDTLWRRLRASVLLGATDSRLKMRFNELIKPTPESVSALSRGICGAAYQHRYRAKEAWRILPGESPGWVRANHPPPYRVCCA